MSTNTNHVHAAPPTSERVIRRSERRGGSVVELRLSFWDDHESLTYTKLANGKAMHLALAPHEVRGFALAMLATADERNWS